MTFNPPHCPQCGQRPTVMVESVLVGTALIEDADEGLRCDESEVHWDSCEPLIDDAGRVTLGCAQRHEWQASSIDVKPS